jgi:hypothetical protein
MRRLIEDAYEWYVQQAENPANTPRDRELWRQLADGLAPRLIEDSHEQDDALW